MPHGYIDPKKIAGLGQALLEEAILAVLAEARAENKGSLTNKEISELAGIYCHSGHSADYGIVRLLADKLCGDKRISNERDSTYGPLDDHWKLVKPPVK